MGCRGRKLLVSINPALSKLAVPISSLRPDPKNARAHGARSLAAIRSSLATYGQQKPIVALADGTVIAGNGTLRAATELGWPALAVVRFADEAKARAFAVADNRASELSEWDVDELVATLGTFEDPGTAGFDASEVQELLDFQKNPFVTARVAIDDLKPHPRNYQVHPEDQLRHIIRSIETHGFYRNVVVARDNTILAGHGVVEAAKKMGKLRVPVIRLDVDPASPRALKVLTSDNEISHLAEADDRALTELLREIMGAEQGGLEGTGYNEQQLAALAMVTRPASEIADFDAATEWLGMPEYDSGEYPIKLVVCFPTMEARQKYIETVSGLEEECFTKRGEKSKTWSATWPAKDREDASSLKFKTKDTSET